MTLKERLEGLRDEFDQASQIQDSVERKRRAIELVRNLDALKRDTPDDESHRAIDTLKIKVGRKFFDL